MFNVGSSDPFHISTGSHHNLPVVMDLKHITNEVRAKRLNAIHVIYLATDSYDCRTKL